MGWPKGKTGERRTPGLNYTSRSLHQLLSKPTFSHQRPHNVPRRGDSTKAVSASAHIRRQVCCVNSCWQLDVGFWLGFKTHHHLTGAEPCTPLKLTTSGSPCLVAPCLSERQESHVGNFPDFQEREGDPFFFPSGKKSNLKSRYLVQSSFLPTHSKYRK